MRTPILIAAAATALLAAAPALASPAVCIQRDNIKNWSSIDDRHIVLLDYRHKRALLTLIGTCSGFKFHEALAIKTPGEIGISCISNGDDILTRDAGLPGRCSIVKIEPYDGPVLQERHDADHGS
jgi:Family of unknown function (DUF6491)